jgi:hypothetical protein
MNLSTDVLDLNPELHTARHVTYKAKPERLLIDDGYDSQLERDFGLELRARGGQVQLHGWTFHLPGGVDYTPDFIETNADRTIVYEVKGDLKQKNARDSRTRFKFAAGLYPALRFVWVTRDRRGEWHETLMRVSVETAR